jgi:hypothetical protein
LLARSPGRDSIHRVDERATVTRVTILQGNGALALEIKHCAIRYAQFDSTRAAGFTEGLRVAALAEQQAVMIAPHTAPELHGHRVAALPRCGFGGESHGDSARNARSHHLLVGGAETRDSFVHLNDKPGFGWRSTGTTPSAMPPDRGPGPAGRPGYHRTPSYRG